MIWVVMVAFAGLAFAFVKVRRQRKGAAGQGH
jgi:hypothetical protein